MDGHCGWNVHDVEDMEYVDNIRSNLRFLHRPLHSQKSVSPHEISVIHTRHITLLLLLLYYILSLTLYLDFACG